MLLQQYQPVTYYHKLPVSTTTRTPTRKRPRRRLPPAERRALIEEAAARLFAERGYAGTRLDDVAAAAHVTKPMLYRHFESKKALYLALLERHRGQLTGHLEVPARDAPRADRLRAIYEAWFAGFEESPHTWKMLFLDATGDAEIQDYRRSVQASARAVVAAFLAARAELPPRLVEPMAELVRSGMAGLAWWWLDHPEVPRAVMVETMTRASAGLLPDGDRGASR
jgi:AcrR family transcriptional regulator